MEVVVPLCYKKITISYGEVRKERSCPAVWWYTDEHFCIACQMVDEYK